MKDIEQRIAEIRETAKCNVILSQVHEAEIKMAQEAISVIDHQKSLIFDREKIIKMQLEDKERLEEENQSLREKLEVAKETITDWSERWERLRVEIPKLEKLIQEMSEEQ